MSISDNMPFSSKCVFKETFYSLNQVQSYGGVVVAATVDRGISPTGVNGRVTYGGTQNALVYATKATVRVRLRAGTARATLCPLISKCNTPIPDAQWIFLVSTLNAPIFYVPNAAADFVNYCVANAALVVGQEYTLHAVYDGSLAAGSRVILYRNGVLDASVINGVIPVSMRANSVPITIFSYDGSAATAPSNDYFLRDARVHAMAMSAAEVLDDYLNQTYVKVVP